MRAPGVAELGVEVGQEVVGELRAGPQPHKGLHRAPVVDPPGARLDQPDHALLEKLLDRIHHEVIAFLGPRVGALCGVLFLLLVGYGNYRLLFLDNRLVGVSYVTAALVGNFEVSVSAPAFGVWLAFLGCGATLAGTLMGLKQRPA